MKSIFVKQWKKYFILSTLLFSGFVNTEYAAAGTVLVTNVLSNSVTLFDEQTLQSIKELSVGFMPHEVAVSPNGKLALVSNFGPIVNVKPGNTLTLIDIAEAKVLQTITLAKGSRPHGIHFISDTQALVTAQGIQSLLMVDVIDGKVIKILPLTGAGAHMVIVDAELRFAYVANVESGTVCKIDLKTFSLVAEVKIGKEAEGIALTLDENLLLVTDRKDNFVAVLRTKDLILLKTIKTGYGPVRVALFDNGRSAIVINTVSGSAQVIDIASLTISKTFNTSQSSPFPVPINISVRNDQKTAYITNFFAGNIILVSLDEGKILNTFKASLMPDGVAVSNSSAKKN